MMLKEVIFTQLEKKEVKMEDLLQSYEKTDDIFQIATAVERMRWTRPDTGDTPLFAVQWIKNTPCGNGNWRQEVTIDFYEKEQFLRDFKPNSKLLDIDLWGMGQNSLDEYDYDSALQAAMYNLRVKPVSQLGMLRHCLAAEIISEEKYGEKIAETFLKTFFRHIIDTRLTLLGKRPASVERRSGAQMTVEESKRMIKACFIFNKLSLHEALSECYRELMRRREIEDSYAVTRAVLAAEASSDEDLPVYVYSEDQIGTNEFLRAVKRVLERDHHSIIMLDEPDDLLYEYEFCDLDRNAIIVLRNLHDMQQSEHQTFIEAYLIKLLRERRKIVFTSGEEPEMLKVNSELKAMLETGCLIMLEE